MPRAALYARVSTAEQTVDPQLHALREYARARGVEVVEEYVDQGVSGSRDQRPALDRLLKDARRRRFDAVACLKLDRLARSVRHLTTLAAEFERDLIRERTRAGMRAARRRGKRIGRPRAISGSATFALERGLSEGRSVRSLARELGVSRATVTAEARRLGLTGPAS